MAFGGSCFTDPDDEWDPDWDPWKEVEELYGEDWMEKHGVVISSETCFPGLEAGWFVCTLCHKQLAGMYGMYGHLKSRGHREWVTLRNIELGPQAAALGETKKPSRPSSSSAHTTPKDIVGSQAPIVLPGGWQAPPLPQSQQPSASRQPLLAIPSSTAPPRSPKANKIPVAPATVAPVTVASVLDCDSSSDSSDEETVVREKTGPISWESHPIGAPPPLPAWPSKSQASGSPAPPPPTAPPPPASALPPTPPPPAFNRGKELVQSERDVEESDICASVDRCTDIEEKEQGDAPMENKVMSRVIRAYTGQEVSEIGESEAGYLPVEKGEIVERLCSPVAGHSRNQSATYVFATRYVDGAAAQQGWLPADLLQSICDGSSANVATSRIPQDEEKILNGQGAQVAPPPAFLGA